MYQEADWFFDMASRSICRAVAGERDLGVMTEIDLEISYRDIPKLVEALENNGFIQPRLDERLRSEDLKITHRLLDIIGGQQK